MLQPYFYLSLIALTLCTSTLLAQQPSTKATPASPTPVATRPRPIPGFENVDSSKTTPSRSQAPTTNNTTENKPIPAKDPNSASIVKIYYQDEQQRIEKGIANPETNPINQIPVPAEIIKPLNDKDQNTKPIPPALKDKADLLTVQAKEKRSDPVSEPSISIEDRLKANDPPPINKNKIPPVMTKEEAEKYILELNTKK
jgi:hypothetical protein